jgi:hypothetical protein
VLYFKTDDQMRAAGDRLATDSRVTEMKRETKSEAYVRYKTIFADQPELVNLARPDSLPASVQFTPATGVDKDSLLGEMRKNFPVDRADDTCSYADRTSQRPTR